MTSRHAGRIRDLAILAIMWGLWCWVFHPMDGLRVFRLFHLVGGDLVWGGWMVGAGSIALSFLRRPTWGRVIAGGALVVAAWASVATFFVVEASQRATTLSSFHTGILMYCAMMTAAISSVVQHARGNDHWTQ